MRPRSLARLEEALRVSGRSCLHEQRWLQDDALSGDSLKVKLGEQVHSVGEGEEVEGCLVVECRTRIAVDVRERLVDIGLCQMIEGRALGQDQA